MPSHAEHAQFVPTLAAIGRSLGVSGTTAGSSVTRSRTATSTAGSSTTGAIAEWTTAASSGAIRAAGVLRPPRLGRDALGGAWLLCRGGHGQPPFCPSGDKRRSESEKSRGSLSSLSTVQHAIRTEIGRGFGPPGCPPDGSPRRSCRHHRRCRSPARRRSRGGQLSLPIGYAKQNLREVRGSAAKHGPCEVQEAGWVRDELPDAR